MSITSIYYPSVSTVVSPLTYLVSYEEIPTCNISVSEVEHHHHHHHHHPHHHHVVEHHHHVISDGQLAKSLKDNTANKSYLETKDCKKEDGFYHDRYHSNLQEPCHECHECEPCHECHECEPCHETKIIETCSPCKKLPCVPKATLTKVPGASIIEGVYPDVKNSRKSVKTYKTIIPMKDSCAKDCCIVKPCKTIRRSVGPVIAPVTQTFYTGPICHSYLETLDLNGVILL